MPLSGKITRIRIRATRIPSPSTRLIAGISIGHTIAATAPTWRIAGVCIGGALRTATTCHAAPIARFITGVGIGFTAAGLLGGWPVLAWQIGLRRCGQFAPLRHRDTRGHGKASGG
jgi:hypothetical protein